MWQPIETAPRDGTRVILYREGYAEDQAIAWWDTVISVWRPVNGSVFTSVTHWQHLPSPPQPPTHENTDAHGDERAQQEQRRGADVDPS